MEDDFKYRAFISYSHRDAAFADGLHRFLETYRVPKALVGRVTRDGAVPGRLYPVFRDREELPTASDLGDNLRDALASSRYLIVVCSPHSAVSHWVNEEIRSFKAMGREDRVLAIVIDGEPNATDRPGLGLPECFPPALRFRIGGELGTERAEPIAADARHGKDGAAAARLKLVAGLLGVGYAELADREGARRRKRRRSMGALGLALIALFGCVWWAGEISKRREVDRQTVKEWLVRAENAATSGDDRDAALYYAEAYQLDAKPSLRISALEHLAAIGVARQTVSLGEPACWLAASPDGGRFLAMGERGLVRVYDSGNSKQVSEFRIGVETYAFRRAAFSPDVKFVFAAAEYAQAFDAGTGSPLGKAVPFETITIGGGGVREFVGVGHAALDPGGERIVVLWDQEGLVQSFGATTGEPVSPRAPMATGTREYAFLWDDDPFPTYSPDRELTLDPDDGVRPQLRKVASGAAIGEPLRHEGGVSAAAFFPDGSGIVTGGSDRRARKWSTDSGIALGVSGLHPGTVTGVRISPDGNYVLTTSGDSAFLWDRFLRLEMVLPHSSEVVRAVFGPDSRTIFTASKDGVVAIWDVGDRRLRPRVAGIASWEPQRAIALGTGGQTVLAQPRPRRRLPIKGTEPENDAAEPVPAISLFDTQGGGWRWSTARFADEIAVASISPDRRRFATLAGSQLRIWDFTNGAPVGEPFASPAAAGGDSETPAGVFLWSADGKRLASIVNSSRWNASHEGLIPEASVTELDSATGRVLGPSRPLGWSANAAAMLPSGDLLISQRDGVHRLRAGVDEPDANAVVRLEGIVMMALSPDAKTLFVGSRETGKLYDTRNFHGFGAAMARDGMTERHGAEFSPDGRLLLTWEGGASGARVRVFDARTGAPIGRMQTLGDSAGSAIGARFDGAEHIVALSRAGLVRYDLSFLLRKVAPEQLVGEIHRATHRELGRDGAAKTIPAERWGGRSSAR